MSRLTFLSRITATLSAVMAGLALAQGVPLRVATLNVQLGLGDPQSAEFNATREILARIDADVVALQELQIVDLQGEPSTLSRLANSLGYGTIHLAGTTDVLDFNSRVAFLSRHPVLRATDISPPAGARDMTRQASAVVVDLPGLESDPTIVTLHLKCCLDPDDSFRRAVELQRVVSQLEGQGLGEDDHVVVLGDFNLIGFDLAYDELPTGLPGSFVLGADISFPVPYRLEPDFYFAPLAMTALDARQLDGNAATAGTSVLDYILATPALTTQPHGSEIYDSALDLSNSAGLLKDGEPLANDASAIASDHLVVFADFNLGEFPSLQLSASSSLLAESTPPDAAFLTVVLPSPPPVGQTVAVTIRSSDPSEALPAESSIEFSAGVASREVGILVQPDDIADGDQVVTITASAPGFNPATLELTILDTSPTEFTLTNEQREVTERFDHFDGSTQPARWPVSGGTWRGRDTGAQSVPGNYAYGPETDPSLGFLPGDGPVASTATFVNQTGEPITALEITYDAEQWRASEQGSADRLVAELLVDDLVIPLPELGFRAATDLPTGPIAGGSTASLRTAVTGAGVAAGSRFHLRITALPGAGGGGSLPSDVFLNEMHYDNTGSDLDEFLEVVVGPGYSGTLSELSVVLYNGSGGSVYGIHPLDGFQPGRVTPSGHRFYSKSIPGIQNGSPDGIAIVRGGEVLHFLSYEGQFVATDGPAQGLSSAGISAQQDSPVPPPGSGSIGLTGSGGVASDFSWTRFPGPYTRGEPNAGQTLTAPAGSQGIAIDNLVVKILPDTDLDGIPDRDDPDDDNDGLPDELEAMLGTDPLHADSDRNGIPDGDEDADRDGQGNLAEALVTGTDPLDPNSRFELVFAFDPQDPGSLSVRLSTREDRLYYLEASDDLGAWNVIATREGTGADLVIPVPRDMEFPARYFRARVTLP